MFFFSIFSPLERTRPAASMGPPCLICLSTSTDCESCTRPISTCPESMKVDEYGLTRGMCFVAHRLEEVAVAGLLWIPWCIWMRRNFVFFFGFFFERTRPATSMRPPCLIYPSTSSMVFVNEIYDMVVYTQFHKFYGTVGRSRVFCVYSL